MKKMIVISALSLFFVTSSFAQEPGPASQPASKVAATDPMVKMTKTKLAADKAKEAAKPEAKVVTAVKEVKEEGTLPWWKFLLQNLMELMFLILTIMATAFVRVLMKKYGFESDSAKINDLLEKGSGFAEQWSIKKLKLDGEPVEGAKKMEVALEFVQKMAKEYKLADKGSDWWEEKLESWLGVKNGHSK